jgi:MoaA/NifB/PqqE/SkfB family radical SAM enzyme
MNQQPSKPENHPSPPRHKDERSVLRLVAWETTRNCNLACIHCRASATMGPYSGELDTTEAFRLLDQIAEVAKPIVILTGGEPLLRDDIFDIASYGTAKGLRMVMAPNGTLIPASSESASAWMVPRLKATTVSERWKVPLKVP